MSRREGFLVQTRHAKRIRKKLWIGTIIKASEKTRRSGNSKRRIMARHVLKHFRVHDTTEYYIHEMKIVLGGLMYMQKCVFITALYNRLGVR